MENLLERIPSKDRGRIVNLLKERNEEKTKSARKLNKEAGKYDLRYCSIKRQLRHLSEFKAYTDDKGKIKYSWCNGSQREYLDKIEAGLHQPQSRAAGVLAGVEWEEVYGTQMVTDLERDNVNSEVLDLNEIVVVTEDLSPSKPVYKKKRKSFSKRLRIAFSKLVRSVQRLLKPVPVIKDGDELKETYQKLSKSIRENGHKVWETNRLKQAIRNYDTLGYLYYVSGSRVNVSTVINFITEAIGEGHEYDYSKLMSILKWKLNSYTFITQPNDKLSRQEVKAIVNYVKGREGLIK